MDEKNEDPIETQDAADHGAASQRRGAEESISADEPWYKSLTEESPSQGSSDEPSNQSLLDAPLKERDEPASDIPSAGEDQPGDRTLIEAVESNADVLQQLLVLFQ